jgi:hypothetical protein
MARVGVEGWRAWSGVPRVVAAGAMTVPVVIGFVALGAAVIVIQSVRDVARETWARLPGVRRPREPAAPRSEDAA